MKAYSDGDHAHIDTSALHGDPSGVLFCLSNHVEASQILDLCPVSDKHPLKSHSITQERLEVLFRGTHRLSINVVVTLHCSGHSRVHSGLEGGHKVLREKKEDVQLDNSQELWLLSILLLYFCCK